MSFPDAKGRYGAFGGRYVPETLVPALDRLQAGIVNLPLGQELARLRRKALS